MPEHTNIDPEWGIAEIVACDEVTIEQMTMSQRHVARACKSGSVRGLLYDGRYITQSPDEGDLYRFAKQTVKGGTLQGIPFALLTRRESALPHMFLTMTVSRLGHTVRVFAERQAALDWLREESATPQDKAG